jgi:hypothetical protein
MESESEGVEVMAKITETPTKWVKPVMRQATP